MAGPGVERALNGGIVLHEDEDGFGVHGRDAFLAGEFYAPAFLAMGGWGGEAKLVQHGAGEAAIVDAGMVGPKAQDCHLLRPLFTQLLADAGSEIRNPFLPALQQFLTASRAAGGLCHHRKQRLEVVDIARYDRGRDALQQGVDGAMPVSGADNQVRRQPGDALQVRLGFKSQIGHALKVFTQILIHRLFGPGLHHAYGFDPQRHSGIGGALIQGYHAIWPARDGCLAQGMLHGGCRGSYDGSDGCGRLKEAGNDQQEAGVAVHGKSGCLANSNKEPI